MMAIEMIRNIPKGSISDVKKSPMDIFKKSEELKQGVYILNRDNVAGVMISKQQYEGLLDLIEELEEKVLETKVAERLARYDTQDSPETYTVEEVFGKTLMEMQFDPDEEDEWE
ncbi:hypothetical protein FM115_03200 [Marinilactibacillus psychrotolerans 42ea]|uniref:Uncharacterized protein n=2 Tax=Marinilactibacillus psychrotolerans TaxID=191770 RepID=A0A1R4IZ97_9LACT|nr:hypothetical protein FM115_03200 [Marinilactibacillus psychrotolerans 42ea]